MMNKKFFAALIALVVCVFSGFAEIEDYRRVVEFGVEVEAGASNNYFRASDLLVEDLVIDLQKLAKEIPASGFKVDYLVNTKSWFALNLSERCRINTFWGVEGSGYGNISKDLFEILDGGLAVNMNRSVDIDFYADLFLDAGFSVKTMIRDHGVRITPTVFVPLLHTVNTKASVRYQSNEYGKIRASADIPVTVYSIVGLEQFKEKTVDSSVVQEFLNEAVNSMGFDLYWEVEHRLTNTFEGSAFTRMPLIPGRLTNKTTARYWGYFEQDNFLGYLNETQRSDKDWGNDDLEYSGGWCAVHRPFIIGSQGAWRPFGNWCVIRPKIDMVIRNPWSGDYQIFGEYSLSTEFVLLKVLGLYFGTAYENLTFKQTLGFMFNTRIMELDAYATLRGGDFANSFLLSGASACISVKFGF